MAKILQFPHVLEGHQRLRLREEEKEELTQRVLNAVHQVVENHDGYLVDLFLKMIDDIILSKEENNEEMMAQLQMLRYVVSRYCMI